MTPPDVTYSVALMVAGLVCLTAGGFVLQTRRTSSGSLPLAILLFALSWWDLTYSLFWADAPAPFSNFWLYITYAGAVIVPGALLLFALQISGEERWARFPFSAVLMVEPVLVLVLLFTDAQHGLFFGGGQTEHIGVIRSGGPVFLANLVYSYLLILAAFILLVRRFIQTSGIYRKQVGVILIGIGFPWLNSIVFVAGLSPFPNADNTPFSFTIAGLAFTYALFRYRLLDIIPIARHVLIENMSDGVLVLDAQNRLVDINPAAERVLGFEQGLRIGQSVETVFAEWAELVEAFYDANETYAVVPIGNPPQGYFDLKISSLYDHDNRFLGRLIVWHDITALKRAQDELQEQAIRDPLTGLYNRRHLNEALEREIMRARLENYPISFVMIDIDYFKTINDTFGHHAGDIILQKLATQLLSQTRIGDIVCRYGGEEFLVVLPNVTAEIAFQIAERWRRVFLGSTMPLEYVDAKATVSCGIAEFPLAGDTRHELISAADKALYQAKQGGRNRVIVWQTQFSDEYLEK